MRQARILVRPKLPPWCWTRGGKQLDYPFRIIVRMTAWKYAVFGFET